MTTTILARCSECQAVVNPNWSACLACRAPLDSDTPAAPYHPASGAPDWLMLWQRVAQLSGGISSQDPRRDPMLNALAECEAAYRAKDEALFATATDRVTSVACYVPGATVYWTDQRNRPCGPAPISDVILSDGRLWVWLEWDRAGRWLNETLITRIEPKEGMR